MFMRLHLHNKFVLMGNKLEKKQYNNDIIEHPRLGLIKLVENPNYSADSESEYPELIEMHTQSLSNSQYKKWKEELSFYDYAKSSNKTLRKSKSQKVLVGKHLQPITYTETIRDIIFLPVSSKLIEKGFCGGSCDMEIFYPNFSIVLSNQISNRYIAQKTYSETEIWYLLYNLILLERFLQPYDRRIGNVHPSNILINEEDGVMKIIIGVSIPNEKSSFMLLCESHLEDVYLAPEEIDYTCIQKCRYPSNVDPNLAQVFSIGMTVLETGTLECAKNLYDRGPYRLNTNKMRMNLNIFRARYGAFLTNILEGMLNENPKNRRSCQQVYEVLNPHENQILNLEPFLNKMTGNPKLLKKQSNQSSHQSNSFLDGSKLNNVSSCKSLHNANELYESKYLGGPQKLQQSVYEKKKQPYTFNSAGGKFPPTYNYGNRQDLDGSSHSKISEIQPRTLNSQYQVKRSTFTT